MFGAFHLGHYIPLTWLTLGIDYVVWGMDPFGYHLTNLILHAANAALVFLLAARLLGRASPALAADSLGLRFAASAAALLFSLHPLRVESVVWVTERRDVLCGLFYLLAILAYLRWCDAQSRGPRNRGWFCVSLAAFAAALLSKSMAVSLPVVLVILDLYPLKRLTLNRALIREPNQRRVLWEKLPFVLLAAAAAAGAIIAIRHTPSLVPISGLGVAERLSLVSFSLAFYPWKTLVPVSLSALYEMPDVVRWWSPSFLLTGSVALAVTGLAVGLRRRWPALAAVWASYVVMLLPVSGIAANGQQIAADRYTYLPCLGWALLAGAGQGAAWLALRRTRSALEAARWAVLIVLVVSASLGALSWRQAGAWHDTETLWTRSLRAAPSAVGEANLGDALEEQGRRADAVAHYEAALRLKPNYGRAHVSLAIALAGQGRLVEAVGHNEEAVRLLPGSAVPYNNLGLVLAAQGRTEEAIARYREALRLLPDYADAHNNLGIALARQGRQAEAIWHFREALRVRPGFPGVHTSLGIAQAGLGHTAEALQSFRDAVTLRPSDAEARNNLGLILVRAGRTDEAEAQFREALKINPEFRDARSNLDRLLALRSEGSR